MKFTALFLLSLVLGTFAISNDQKLEKMALDNRIKVLKESGWGRIGLNLMELQLKTNGPIAELVHAFVQLIQDLNFKLQSEQEEYQWNAGEHHQLDIQINGRITDARVRFGVARDHLQNTLLPLKDQLEGDIARDEELVSNTQGEMERTQNERNHAQALYEDLDGQHDTAIEAVMMGQDLVQGLNRNAPSLVQIKKTQNILKDLSNQLKGMGVFEHFTKALISLAQDFVDAEAAQRVYDLLEQLRSALVQSKEDIYQANEQCILVCHNVMEIARQTVHDAQGRIGQNQASLDVCNSQIEFQEGERDTAQADRETAEEELEIETARWDALVAAYEDLMTELHAELDAVDRCLQLFSGADVGQNMIDRIDIQ